jgi:hypothetical protein
MSAAATYRKLVRIKRARDMKNRVKLSARKGDRTMESWVVRERATEVARGWADQGWAVTVTCYPENYCSVTVAQ